MNKNCYASNKDFDIQSHSEHGSYCQAHTSDTLFGLRHRGELVFTAHCVCQKFRSLCDNLARAALTIAQDCGLFRMDSVSSVVFKPRGQRSNPRKRLRTASESCARNDDGQGCSENFALDSSRGVVGRPVKPRAKLNFVPESGFESFGVDKEAVSGMISNAEGDGNAATLKHETAATAARPQIDDADETAVNHDTAEQTKKKTKKEQKPFGPLRAPTHIRSSVRVDYQPDICKDYKETGYCGFGDACKFLHDRGDYKAGWQLDRDWEEEQKAKRDDSARGYSGGKDITIKSVDVDDDGMPFACYICRSSFTSPVVTLCNHYFCESCILERMNTSASCPICAKQLRGILNSATKLLCKLEERSVRKET